MTEVKADVSNMQYIIEEELRRNIQNVLETEVRKLKNSRKRDIRRIKYYFF